ncbi:MAG: hypothetical protein OQK67_04565 [Chlorobium sp.]|nr:hypothetical protein [Chlorobium sp.]
MKKVMALAMLIVISSCAPYWRDNDLRRYDRGYHHQKDDKYYKDGKNKKYKKYDDKKYKENDDNSKYKKYK